MKFIQAVVILITRGLILGEKDVEVKAEFFYLGCYEDGKVEDTQLFKAFMLLPTGRDANRCLQTCLQHKFLYFGISQNCMCFCGNSSSVHQQYLKTQEIYCEEHCTNISSTRYMKLYEVRCKIQHYFSNGFIEQTHKSVSFKCEDGFKLKGREQLTCNMNANGTVSWDGDLPICVTAGIGPGLKFVVIVLLLLPPILSIVCICLTCRYSDPS